MSLSMATIHNDFASQRAFGRFSGERPPLCSPRMVPCRFSSQPQLADRVIGLQKCPRPIIVPKDSKDDTAPASNNLGRQAHNSVEKPAELHLQQFFPPLPVADEKSEPGFQRPGQRTHHHVRPIRDQVSNRHAQGVQTVFQLLDQVFLVTPIVAEKDHLRRRHLLDVCNVKEVTNIVAQQNLPSFHQKLLAQNDQTVRAVAFDRLIAQFRDMFFLQRNVLVLLFHHDLLFDVHRPFPSFSVAGQFVPSLQNVPAPYHFSRWQRIQSGRGGS